METGISTNDLCKELGINKSKLHYYVGKGLLKPITSIGSAYVFDRHEAKKVFKAIIKLRDNGLQLSEIKKKLNE